MRTESAEIKGFTMVETQMKQYSGRLRPVLLTFFMCLSAALAAWTAKEALFLVTALVLAVVGGIFAVLFSTAKTPTAVVIGASVSVMLLQVAGGFPASLMGAVALIAALVLSFQVRRGEPKTTVQVTVSVILGGGFLLIAAVCYAKDGGSLVPGDLLARYHAFFDELKRVFAGQIKAMLDALDETTLAWYAKQEITKEMLAETYYEGVSTVIDLVELLMPGMLMFNVQLLAYFQISVFRLTARAGNVDALLPSPRWYLVPTQASCIVYLVVAVLYMLSSFFSSGTSMFMVMMANLWLVLLPVMLLCGVRVLLAQLAHPMLRGRTGLVIAVFVFGLFFAPAVAIQFSLFALSFLGAQTLSAMHAVEAEKNKKKE